ncbi:MAG: hypothetical protein ACREUT_15880 [Steroidobacteraceae bacterium]
MSPSRAAARRAGTVVAAALAYAASAAPGHAATNWTYDPRVEVGGTYDDNYLLGETPADQVAVWGPFVNALVDLHGASPRNDFIVTPQVHATLFPGHSEDQSTDGYLNATDTFTTLRTKSVLTGAYANQTIAAADFLPATFPGVELGQPVVSGSGVIVQLERQQSLNLAPSTSIQFSQRGHVDLSVDYDRAWFSQNQAGQIAFQSVSGTAGVGYIASQRSDLSLRGNYISFDPGGTEPSAKHSGLDGEWDYRESTILHFYARAGVGATRGQSAEGRTVTLTDFEGGIGARWTYQITDVVVDLLRTAVPSSFGVLVNQDELRFRVTRRFTPMVAGFFALRGIRTVAAESQATNVPNRSYATGSAGLEWRITRDYSLEASYSYAYQKYENDPLHAASNTLGVSIVYEPHRYDRAPQPGVVGSESPY